MSLFSNGKTFRPQRVSPVGTKGAQLKRHIDATLGSGNLKEAVRLPPGENEDEWLAVNTVDFYNAISVLYGALEEFCTDHTCPVMKAGRKYEYLWADGIKYKKPVRLSAPQYMAKLFDWVEDQMDNRELFPTEIGSKFSPEFLDSVKKIFKRLFRVYAHIYHSHFRCVVTLNIEAHLNTSFKHFFFFTKQFSLIEEKELAPLKELIMKFA
eukprot:g1893.t2